jgi:hypothetical protein
MKAFLMPVAALALCATSLGAMAKDEVMAGVLKERNGKTVTVVLSDGYLSRAPSPDRASGPATRPAFPSIVRGLPGPGGRRPPGPLVPAAS